MGFSGLSPKRAKSDSGPRFITKGFATIHPKSDTSIMLKLVDLSITPATLKAVVDTAKGKSKIRAIRPT